MYYETKDLNLCVVIVSFTGDVAEIRKTYFSAGLLSKKYPVLVVIPDGKTVDLEELNITDLPVMNGGNCVTSLFDTGIENCLGDWAYMVFAGTTGKRTSLS